jgi:hypothetical protein
VWRKKFAAPFEFLTAPQNAAAHSLKTTGVLEHGVNITNDTINFTNFWQWIDVYSSEMHQFRLQETSLWQKCSNDTDHPSLDVDFGGFKIFPADIYQNR